MIKPRMRISKQGGPKLDIEMFVMSKGAHKFYSTNDEYWQIEATFTTFEGAKRYKTLNSMYLCKAMHKATQWLKEMRSAENMFKLDLAKMHSKSHLSDTYKTKQRLRLYVNKDGQHVVKHTPRGTNEVFIGYGTSPDRALASLEETWKHVLRLRADGASVECDGTKLPWWKRWFS